MIKPKADISVVAANYNNGQFLAEFIESVLQSTVTPSELIIIDDGSTDNSVEIIKSYLHHGFIKLVRFDTNLGFAHALNKGLEVSTGKYIARIDPDDIVLPDRFEKQYNFLEEHPEVDLVGGNVVYFNNRTGQEITRSNFPAKHKEILAAFRSGDHGVQHPTVMARAEVYKRYRYNQAVYPAEDYDIFSRMINDGCRFANLGITLNKMRVHPASVSDNIRYSTIEQTFAIRDEVFGGKTGKFRKMAYYRCITNYRSYLSETNDLLKLMHITLATLFMPSKAVRKILAEPHIAVNLSIYLFIFLFLADSIVHQFLDIPVLIAGGLILLFYHLLLMKRYRIINKETVFAFSAFIIIAITNNIIHGFHTKNISDLFFILILFSSFILYRQFPAALSMKMIWILFTCCLILITPSFFGENHWQSVIYQDSTGDDFMRVHHRGFFRIPHLGAYIFGFLSLLFIFRYGGTKQLWHLALAAISVVLCIYTGTRSFIFAVALASLVVLVIRRMWKILLVGTVAVAAIIWYRYELVELTKETFLLQYFWLLTNPLADLEQFPRYVIWTSWLTEMKEFSVLDYLTGRSFYSSIEANKANIAVPVKDIWFHNDFLSIVYSYGLIGFTIYIGFFVKIFKQFRAILRRNSVIQIYFLTMIFCAILNGFYYYYPFFLLIPFFIMIRESKPEGKMVSQSG